MATTQLVSREIFLFHSYRREILRILTNQRSFHFLWRRFVSSSNVKSSIVEERILRFVFVPSIVEERILRFVFVPSIVEEQILWFVFVPSIV